MLRICLHKNDTGVLNQIVYHVVNAITLVGDLLLASTYVNHNIIVLI